MPLESTIPILPARDLGETRRFYEQLGFQTRGWWPDTFGGYAILERDGLEMHFFRFPTLDPAESYAQCYWRVVEVDALHREMVDTGVFSVGTAHLTTPEDKPWGTREFAMIDPNGTLVRIGRAVGAR